jgi:GAF domain-containing protein
VKDPRVPLMETLAGAGDPDQRLESALAGVARDLNLDHCHLYLREAGSATFRLVHSWTQAAGATVPAASGVGGGDAEAGVELELYADPPEDFTEIRTPVGPLIPLRLSVPGRLDGILLLRPRRRLGSSGRRTLLELAGVLGAVVASLRREKVLERDLAANLTREETTSQLRSSAFTLEQFLVLLLDMSVRSTLAEGGFVAVADRTGRLDIRVTNGLSVPIGPVDLEPETGLFDWSLAGDSGALLLRDPERAQQLGIRSILAVPLIREGAPLGVVALTTFTRAAAFTEHNLDLLASFAEQVSLMLENQRVAEDFSARYLGVLEGIARSLDARRPETAGYHARVSRAAAALATALALDPGEVDAVRRAGLIHDVGLAAIPAAEQAFLADVEHPAVAAQLVDALPLHPSVAAAVACHHEWYDGWGVPRGLQRDGIPMAGRVLALAAFAVEMSCGDVARQPWPLARVADEVRRRRGTQFDPDLVDTGLPALTSAIAQAPEESDQEET